MTQQEKDSVVEYGVFAVMYEQSMGPAEVEDGLGMPDLKEDWENQEKK